VALVFNGISHAVMMASPLDLEHFAIGFSLSEGIVSAVSDIYAIDIAGDVEQGIQIALDISAACFAGLKERRRSLTGRTGCGICGVESLQQIRVPLPLLKSDLCVSHSAVELASNSLSAHQPLQSLTGGLHAAAWCNADGAILAACEDVGRHNALDKLIGQLARQGQLAEHAALQGFLLVSSRASYEIVFKAARAGMAMVVAVSAPTSLAIELAGSAGMTLIGFSRSGRHVVYTNPQRLVD
jgi:formate dehydrogenase accessory protein FdhD